MSNQNLRQQFTQELIQQQQKVDFEVKVKEENRKEETTKDQNKIVSDFILQGIRQLNKAGYHSALFYFQKGHVDPKVILEKLVLEEIIFSYKSQRQYNTGEDFLITWADVNYGVPCNRRFTISKFIL